MFAAPELGTLAAGRARSPGRGGDRSGARAARSAPTATLEPADAVAWLEALADALRLADLRLRRRRWPGLRPGRSARVLVDGDEVGSVGQVAAAAAAHHGVAAGAIAFELDLGVLLGATRRSILARPVSRYPSSGVDLAFVVAETVPAGDVLRTLRDAGRRAARERRRCSTRSAPTRSAPAA